MNETLQWYAKHLTDELLPKWSTAAPSKQHRGAFLPRVDRYWKPQDTQVLTLVSQARLLVLFSMGVRLTGSETYRTLVRDGADFLCEHFWDREHGGWFWSCEPDGKLRDDSKDSYGHAFAMVALWEAATVLEDAWLMERMRTTRRVFSERFWLSEGGLSRGCTRDFSPLSRTLSLNPTMHLFDGLLRIRGDDAEADAFAVQVLEHTMTLLDVDGALPELFEKGWRAMSPERGGHVSLGHQWEWARLLWDAEGLLSLEGLAQRGDGFFHYVLERSLRADGLMRSREGSDTLDWWVQFEAARTLLRARTRNVGEVDSTLKRLLWGVRQRFHDEQEGGWFSSPEPRLLGGEHKGDEWKLDYHAARFCMDVHLRA